MIIKLASETSLFRRLWRDTSGLALVEFAYIAPMMIGFIAAGTELSNYAIQSTQVSQLALQVADNGARIGEGDPLANKKITETQINDLLTGAEIHAGRLDIYGSHQEGTVIVPNGRIVVSSLQTVANPNPTNKYNIAWQRCRGLAIDYTPQYGEVGQTSGTNIDGMGPAGRQVTAPAGTPVIFAEVHYRYQPLFFGGFATKDFTDINAIAAMMVRDSRDLTQIYNTAGVPVATC
jgi:Flp pilus assembly pilin Flp